MNTLETIIAKSNEARIALETAGVVLDNNILVKIHGESIELMLCEDDTLSKRVFGGEINVYGYKAYGSSDRNIEINTGSMGSFTPNCVASTKKVFTQAAILSNWHNFSLVCGLLMDKAEAENKLAHIITSQK